MGLDLLTELPEPLIHEILSHLPMREAAATMILSKRWQNVWTTLPRLHFRQESPQDAGKFRDLVSGFLERWKGTKILKFSLSFDADDFDDLELDSWVCFAMEKQVEDLDIEAQHQQAYIPPRSLYTCSSIRKLSLSFVELHIDEVLRWDRLKSFSWEGFFFLKEDDIDRILSGAPQLEALMLWMEDLGVERYNIRSESLKVVRIGYFIFEHVDENVVLRIDAPNLESLEISGIWHTRCLLNVPALKTAILHFDNRDNMLRNNSPHRSAKEAFGLLFQIISHVENLTLNKWSFKLLVDELRHEFFVVFPNAKNLKLYAREAEGILHALNMFPVLEMLVIEHREFAFSLVPPDTIFPNLSLLQLKMVKITWDVQDTPMIRVVKFLLENARVLEKLVLRLRNENEADPGVFISVKNEVMRMPRSSPNAMVTVSKM